MSTRRLIVTALIAGLAILVAGGLQLVRVALADRTVQVLEPGTRAEASGVVATAYGSEVVDGRVIVAVEVEFPTPGAADAFGGGPQRWAMLAGGKVVEVDIDATICNQIGGTDGRSGLGCELAFPFVDGTKVVALRYGDRQRQWKVTATA